MLNVLENIQEYDKNVLANISTTRKTLFAVDSEKSPTRWDSG
jgi:hypothetical protein